MKQYYLLSILIGFFFITNIAAQSIIKGDWSNVKMGGGGFVSAIIACPTEPNLFFARTDVGGAYRWEESSQRWIPLLDWASDDQRAMLGVESIAIDPSDPNKVYMSVGLSGYGWPGASILRSEDYGKSFEIVPMDIYIHGNGMGRQTGEKMMVDPNDGNIIYLGTRQDGLLISEDAGKTWNPIQSFPEATTPNINGVSFVVLDPNSGDEGTKSQTIIAGLSRTGTNLYISYDAGISWEPIPNAPTEEGIMPHRAALSNDGQRLYLTYANGGGPHPQNWDGVNEPMNRGAVFRLNLATGEWTDISPINFWINPSSSGCYGGLSIAQDNSDLLYVSTINHWGQQQFFRDNSSAWGDRIFVSEDGGDSWRQLFQGTNAMKLDQNGINWIAGHNLHWVGSIALDPYNTSRLFACSGNGVFMSDNIDGDQPVMKFMPHGIEETVPLDMISIPEGPFVSIIGDYDGWVHQDIHEFPLGPRHTPNMGTSSGISFSNQAPEVLVRAGGSGRVLYYSLDQGDSWTAFEQLPINDNSGRVAVSSDEEDHLVAWIPGGQSDKLYITSNFGDSWTNLWNSAYGDINGAHPYADPIAPRVFYVYASGKGALYKCVYPKAGRPEVEKLADLNSGGSPHLAVNPYQSEDIWIAMNQQGIERFVDGKVETIDNIAAYAVTFGQPLNEDAPPTLFVWGKVKETEGLYRSIDMGKTWFRMNDDEHEYGGLGNAGMILGDRNVFGRVYMSTAGRGIAVGDSGLDTLYLDPDDITTNVSESKLLKQVKVFPNPVHQQLLIQSTEEIGLVQIFDTRGKLITRIREKNNFFDINTESWLPGLYFAELISATDGERVCLKILKQ